MKRYLIVAMCLSLLVATFAGMTRLATAYFDAFDSRYPDAIVVSAGEYDFTRLRDGDVIRQGTYQTADPLATVKRWYMARLEIAPASDMNLSGDCVWLVGSKLVVRLERTVSVLLCPVHAGTRVVVNERVGLAP
jgi:hypothetical protein